MNSSEDDTEICFEYIYNLNMNCTELTDLIQIMIKDIKWSMSDYKIQLLINIIKKFNCSIPLPLKENMLNKTNKIFEQIQNNEIPLDTKLLNLTSLSIKVEFLYIKNILKNSNNTGTNITSNNTINSTEKAESQKIINELKDKIESFTDMLVKSISQKNITSLISKTELFSLITLKAIKSDNQTEKFLEEKNFAIKNKISFPNMTSCENILKKEYNISDEIDLIKKQMEYSPLIDLDKIDDEFSSNLISFEFFNPLTGDKLNKSICNNAPISVNIPFKASKRINIEKYQQAKTIQKVIDLYNSQSPGYHTRCLKTEQFNNTADVSVNYRRTKLFQNQTISCAEGCDYKGLDENKYVMCDCSMKDNGELSNSSNDESLLSLPPMNYDIVLCYYEVIIDPQLNKNSALIILNIVNLISIIAYFVFMGIETNLILFRCKDVQRNDYFGYSEELYSKEKYFKRKFFIKKDKNTNLQSLYSIINQEIEKFNSYEDEIIEKFDYKKLYPLEKQKRTKDDNHISSQKYYSKKINYMKFKENSKINYKNHHVKNVSFYFKMGYFFKIRDEKSFDEYFLNNDRHEIKQEIILSNYYIKIDAGNTKMIDIEKKRNYKLKKKKIQFNDKFIFDLNFITLKDYDELNPYDKIKYDERPFYILFFDILKQENIVINLIFHNSVIEPLWIRLLVFYLGLNLNFSLNAFFFSDDYIDIRADVPADEANSIIFTILNEIIKVFFALLVGFVLEYIIELSLAIPEELEEEFNNRLIHKNRKFIVNEYKKFDKKMKKKYIYFAICLITMNIICTLYSIIFCSIYPRSVSGWINGSILGVLLDVGVISFGITVIKFMVKILIRNFKILRFLIIIEYSFFIMNFFL